MSKTKIEFTDEEIFMLKLAMNDIYNSGNEAYEGIRRKLSQDQPEGATGEVGPTGLEFTCTTCGKVFPRKTQHQCKPEKQPEKQEELGIEEIIYRLPEKEIDWIKLLKENKAHCYIKPNRYKHESGFRCFEVGYLAMGDDNKIEDKLVLNKYSDHIQLYEYTNNRIAPNLDLTLDGYIRIFPYAEGVYWWGTLDYVLSSAQIKLLKEEE